jgi:hypothetical protein
LSEWLWYTAHLRVKEPWSDDPVVKRFLENPELTYEKERAGWSAFQEEIPGGLRLPVGAFYGGIGPVNYRWNCMPGRCAIFLYGKTDYPATSARFFLKKLPATTCRLEIEGQNSLTLIRISVNEHLLFEGPSGFVDAGWGWKTFMVPPDTFKTGENIIKIENTESTGFNGRGLMLSDVKLLMEQ